MKRTLLIRALAALGAASSATAATISWDFEGGGSGTRSDTTGMISFDSTVDPVANDTTWAVGSVGETNAVNYAGLALINGEHNNRGAGNDWFLRSDHAYSNGTLSKPGDGRTGVLQSGSFLISTNSSFSFYLGGGVTGGSFVLRNAADGSVILSADPLANGHIYRVGSNSQANDGLQNWTSSDLTGAGIVGSTEVYLTVEDDSTGGWGHVQLDDITVTEAEFIPEPSVATLGLIGIIGLLVGRRRR